MLTSPMSKKGVGEPFLGRGCLSRDLSQVRRGSDFRPKGQPVHLPRRQKSKARWLLWREGSRGEWEELRPEGAMLGTKGSRAQHGVLELIYKVLHVQCPMLTGH